MTDSRIEIMQDVLDDGFAEIRSGAGRLALVNKQIAALEANGFAIVPNHATPKMCEAALFANNDALLMSASSEEMANAYQAMIAAANKP